MPVRRCVVVNKTFVKKLNKIKRKDHFLVRKKTSLTFCPVADAEKC